MRHWDHNLRSTRGTFLIVGTQSSHMLDKVGNALGSRTSEDCGAMEGMLLAGILV